MLMESMCHMDWDFTASAIYLSISLSPCKGKLKRRFSQHKKAAVAEKKIFKVLSDYFSNDVTYENWIMQS